MSSIYRTPDGQERARHWCMNQLERWDVEHRRFFIDTCLGATHVVALGQRSPELIVLSGTNFNAATSLALATALGRHWPAWFVDLPGQPGLSAPERPARGGLAAYSEWLSDVLAKASVGTVHVFGHSLGGGVALACNSPRIAGRVLVAPAGIVRLRVPPSVLVASIPWLMRPTHERSVKLLRPMHGPGHEPSPLVTEWMTLVGSVCRSSLAPSPLPESWLESLRGSNVVASGEHAVFQPPRALRSRASSALRSEVQSIDGAGHLAPDEYPEQMVQLISSAMRMSGV